MLLSSINQFENFLFAKDRHGKFYFCNEKFAEAAGLDSAHQIIGKTDHDLVWREQAEMFQSGDHKVLLGKEFINVEEVMIQSGKVANILVTKQKFTNSQGRCIGVIGSFVDITGYSLRKKSGHYDAKTGRFCLGEVFHNARLSPKQYQVFKYILLGHSSKKIAECLSMSPRTIEAYTDTIKHKLQCQSKGDIIATAIEAGLMHVVDKIKISSQGLVVN